MTVHITHLRDISSDGKENGNNGEESTAVIDDGAYIDIGAHFKKSSFPHGRIVDLNEVTSSSAFCSG